MQVTVCENACGMTSLDPTADIQMVSVRARVNGADESSYDGKIEICATCRASLLDKLRVMFTAINLSIRVGNMQSSCHQEEVQG